MMRGGSYSLAVDIVPQGKLAIWQLEHGEVLSQRIWWSVSSNVKTWQFHEKLKPFWSYNFHTKFKDKGNRQQLCFWVVCEVRTDLGRSEESRFPWLPTLFSTLVGLDLSTEERFFEPSILISSRSLSRGSSWHQFEFGNGKRGREHEKGREPRLPRNARVCTDTKLRTTTNTRSSQTTYQYQSNHRRTNWKESYNVIGGYKEGRFASLKARDSIGSRGALEMFFNKVAHQVGWSAVLQCQQQNVLLECLVAFSSAANPEK